MQGTRTWSYRPYRPFLYEVGEIYVCRIHPKRTSVALDWLPIGEDVLYTVFCAVRGEGAPSPVGETRETTFEITGLREETDYAFFVRAGDAASRTRLARTSESVGTVVNYLHPDDEAYAFSGRYLCSPSLLRHPDGYLLASMDLFAANHPQNLTLIYRSDDDGESWHYVCELMPCFWGKLFLHRGTVYMLAVSTEYGDLLIGKSEDGGMHFDAPVTLLRGANGKNGSVGVHKNPQNVFLHDHRLYTTLEWGSWGNKEYGHAAMVMSCDEDADLLDPAAWHFTPPLPFSQFDASLADLPNDTMTIEGTLTLDRAGRLLNVMRFGKRGTAIAYEVDTKDPDAPLSYACTFPFPANYSKFMIRYDSVSDRYYTVATMAYDPQTTSTRDYLALLTSKDLFHWELLSPLLDYRDRGDRVHIGFQYVDFFFEGEDILYLCRTAIGGAHNFHDANYSTFHRIKRFRAL